MNINVGKNGGAARPYVSNLMTAPHASTAPKAAGRPVDAAEVARVAYLLWQKRGSPIGDGVRDWLAAEAEVNGKVRM